MGGIPRLVELICYGSEEIRELAANIHVHKAIVDARAVPVLIWLLNTGNMAQKEKAAGVLSNLLVNKRVVKKKQLEASLDGKVGVLALQVLWEV